MWNITLNNISNTLYRYGDQKVDPQKKENDQAIMQCTIIEEEKIWRVEENHNAIMCNYWGRKFKKLEVEKKRGKDRKCTSEQASLACALVSCTCHLQTHPFPHPHSNLSSLSLSPLTHSQTQTLPQVGTKQWTHTLLTILFLFFWFYSQCIVKD